MPSHSRPSDRGTTSTGVGDDATSEAVSRPRRIAVALTYGALCHGLFALGAGAMVVMMALGMTATFGRLEGLVAWMANALLLAQFPIGHSLLLSKHGRGLLKRLAPAPLAGDLAPSTYVIVASLQLLALFTLWSPSGIVWWQAQGTVLWVMLALYGLSWLLLAKSILDAGWGLQSGLIGWWAVLFGRKPVFPDMPTSGLFAIVRQPIYVSFALTTWLVPTWTPDQLVVAITFTAYCVIGPLFKEARFRKMFGARFDAYARAVPYWVPGAK